MLRRTVESRTLCVKRLAHNMAIRKYLQNNTAIANSTVFQGTLYEHTVVRELGEKLLMKNLEVCGGSYDGGIDIRGKWPVNQIYETARERFELSADFPKKVSVNGTQFKPVRHKLDTKSSFRPLNVLVQCKAFKNAKITGKEIRESMGAFSSCVPASRKNQYVFMLSSPNMLTRDALNVMNALAIPLVYVRVEMLKSHQGWFDLENSGKLQNYYENEFASKFLQNCGVSLWLKFKLYRSPSQKTVPKTAGGLSDLKASSVDQIL
ncbi:LAQU0S02e01178g1_1 [Lachancea quebecensis]|uniref:Required for respiratory growth protein 7, mitochondrial n=1 Tax=Lachancea quebecensis TaxID=1654605 RepID=A0A0P1KNC7_9SACH|nr:LAQU0S02e01178g1_1 [Lachancea quebecensis]